VSITETGHLKKGTEPSAKWQRRIYIKCNMDFVLDIAYIWSGSHRLEHCSSSAYLLNSWGVGTVAGYSHCAAKTCSTTEETNYQPLRKHECVCNIWTPIYGNQIWRPNQFICFLHPLSSSIKLGGIYRATIQTSYIHRRCKMNFTCFQVLCLLHKS
jgi:hypothetical protein